MAVLYRHIRLDTNQPFYIGIGLKESRAYSKANRNKHWKHITNKTAYEVEILFDDLTYEEAKVKEKEFIKLYGRVDLGTGTLVNMTGGGQGVCGLVHSAETRKKMSDNMKGKKLMLGKIHSKETKQKISDTSWNKGKFMSEEYRRNMSQSLKGKKHSNEAKLKMSKASIGKPKTDEHKLKMSLGWIKRRQIKIQGHQ